jgi:hypothetical protein
MVWTSFMGSAQCGQFACGLCMVEITDDQNRCNRLRQCWLLRVLQLSDETVAVGYVHGLQLLELREHRPSLLRVVAVPFQLGDHFALTSDVLRTACYVLLGKGQVVQQPPLRHVSGAWPSQA